MKIALKIGGQNSDLPNVQAHDAHTDHGDPAG